MPWLFRKPVVVYDPTKESDRRFRVHEILDWRLAPYIHHWHEEDRRRRLPAYVICVRNDPLAAHAALSTRTRFILQPSVRCSMSAGVRRIAWPCSGSEVVQGGSRTRNGLSQACGFEEPTA